MKTFNVMLIMYLMLLCGCNTTDKANTTAMSFGIYETVRSDEMPSAIMDTLKTMNIHFEENATYSIIGYITKEELSVLQMDFSGENIQLVRSMYPVDNERQYYSLAAIKGKPAVVNADLKKTKNKGTSVELYFNLEGAQKWADFTKKNVGKVIVFVLDNQICTMTSVGAEIRDGVARIDRLEDESFAKKVAESL
jgi:preprotein translocase subunit SecD